MVHCASFTPFCGRVTSKCLNNPPQRFLSCHCLVARTDFSKQIVIIAHCDRDYGHCMLLLLIIIIRMMRHSSPFSPHGRLHVCRRRRTRLMKLRCVQRIASALIASIEVKSIGWRHKTARIVARFIQLIQCKQRTRLAADMCAFDTWQRHKWPINMAFYSHICISLEATRWAKALPLRGISIECFVLEWPPFMCVHLCCFHLSIRFKVFSPASFSICAIIEISAIARAINLIRKSAASNSRMNYVIFSTAAFR